MKFFVLGFMFGYISRILTVKALRWYFRNKKLFKELMIVLKEFKDEYCLINKSYKGVKTK